MNVEATIRHNGSDGGNYVIPFARYIFSAKIIDEDTFNVISTDSCADSRYGLRRLWTASGVSGRDLAAAAAEFFAVRRTTLAELVGAPSLADRFSPRFLRDAAIYPFAAADRRPALAMGDPMDREARKTAELALGETVAVVVASFEDIVAALGEQGEAAPPTDAFQPASEDSLDNLRDLHRPRRRSFRNPRQLVDRRRRSARRCGEDLRRSRACAASCRFRFSVVRQSSYR